MNTNRVRWSDNDRYFGPLTYARDTVHYRPLSLVLSSGDGDEDHGCRLRISGFGHTLLIALPQIIKPWRRWVDTSRYEWSRGPGSGYWDVHRNEYGFSYEKGFLQILLGPQTHDSTTTKSWSKFLPWTQWRHVRKSYYGLEGEHFWTQPERSKNPIEDWEVANEAKEKCPSRKFAFLDYDGEHIEVTTRIEEMEWHFGTGWFKWLSVFRRPRVRRYLDLQFSSEVGPRKGSWKGGTIGHSIEMMPDELHPSAFYRYCKENGLQFVGEVK